MGGRGSSSGQSGARSGRVLGVDVAARHAEERAVYERGRKRTGVVADHVSERLRDESLQRVPHVIQPGQVRVDWFVTRGDGGAPTYRVEWWTPKKMGKPRRRPMAAGNYSARRTADGWAMSHNEQRFPFTEDGLQAALRFAEGI